MPLAPGIKLGHYEIIAPLGAGGMGEVYRARDTVLKREVAVKILPDSYSSDPERLRRFQQEAGYLRLSGSAKDLAGSAFRAAPESFAICHLVPK
jgi:serine/threonine protein kinase